MMEKNIRFYEQQVKRMIILVYTQNYLGEEDLDSFVDKLWRIFRNKKKVIHNLAVYTKKEVEKGRDLNQVLTNISFFVMVLKEFCYKNIGQPINK